MKNHLPIFVLLASIALMSTSQAHGENLQKKGKALYMQYCASCHGLDGDGTGEEGKGLTPPPANLKEALAQKIVSDEYLFWTIKEGGRNVHTDMPSFEESGLINENDAKALIKYLRTAFH